MNAQLAPGASDAFQRRSFGKTCFRELTCADAVSNRPVLGKTAYRERVRRVLKSQKARTVAKNCALGLRKVCKHVVESGGIATRG